MPLDGINFPSLTRSSAGGMCYVYFSSPAGGILSTLESQGLAVWQNLRLSSLKTYLCKHTHSVLHIVSKKNVQNSCGNMIYWLRNFWISAGEMSQWSNYLLCMSDDLSWIFRTQVFEERETSPLNYPLCMCFLSHTNK